MLIPSNPAFASSGVSVPMRRLAGATRYDTALAISQNGWPKSDYAIIATGENFSDALAATPLAMKYDAPIILVPPSPRDDTFIGVQTELARLGVKKTFIVGGTGVVSSDTESMLQDTLGIQSTRLAGQDRYETAVKIAQEVGVTGNIFVTTGDGYQDALSIASIAAIQGSPIIITPRDVIPDSVSAFLSGQTITKTYVIGSNQEVSNAVLNQLPNAERIDGQNGYERNVAVLSKFRNSLDFSKVYLATGENFPDALAGTALAARNVSPIMLIHPKSNQSLKALVQGDVGPIGDAWALGGEAVLSDATIEQIISVSPM